MKININNESSQSNKIINQKPHQRVHKKTKDSPYSEVDRILSQDMQDAALDVEISAEKDIENSVQRYKSVKLKKWIALISIAIFLVVISITAIFKTFFSKNYTGPEIALLANYFNGTTNFPHDGVQGYLNTNMDSLLTDKLSFDPDVSELKVKNPTITKINGKTDHMANVYFYVTIQTNKDIQTIDCILPLAFEDNQYAPAGDVIFTPNKTTIKNTKQIKNDLLSFTGIAQQDSALVDSSKVFVDNFFSMLYSGQSIDPYYKGDVELSNGDLSYAGMSEWALYSESNGNGYNASCNINLKTINGVVYTTKKYLKIDPSGESWIIMGVL